MRLMLSRHVLHGGVVDVSAAATRVNNTFNRSARSVRTERLSLSCDVVGYFDPRQWVDVWD